MVLDQQTNVQIIHSDMGQYTSELFEDALFASEIDHSYSRKG